MQRLTELCVRHPWATLAFTLALTAAALWSTIHTDAALGTDANLGANHPAVREFNAFLERFGGGYPVVVAYECKDPAVCRRVLDDAALEMASAISRKLLKAPFVSRVSSPATTRLLVPADDLGIDARRFVVDGVAVEDPELVALALADPLWSGTIVSADGSVGAIVVDLSSTEGAAISTTMDAIEEAIRPFESGGFNFHIVGEAAVSVAAQETGRHSASRAGALTGGMLFLALLALLRSVRAVVATLATIGVASAWMVGLLPVIGWHQSHLTSGAATLILVIGCANCVHFATHYLENKSRIASNLERLTTTSRWVAAPCFLTTATTVAAFGSFAISDVLALTQFGVMAGIGVSLAFLLTFSLFPALLWILPARPRGPEYSSAWQEVLSRLTAFGVDRSWVVLLVSVVLASVGALGIPKLRVEMNVAGLWGPDHPVVRAVDFVSANLQQVDRLEIELTLPADATFEDVDVLRTLATLESDIENLRGVGRSQSIVTLVRHTNSLVSDANEALPRSSAAVGELLFFISAGADGVLDPWVSLDQKRTRLSLAVAELSTQEKGTLLQELDALLRSHLPRGWSSLVTGPVVLALRFGEGFSRSQASIVSASSVLVVAMIGIYLRSLPWALLAAIPNAVALVLMFGTMGHWNILLNFGSAIVAPIAIGIAADDTIHFLTEYSRERRAGREPISALRGAICGVGQAVIATAVALALGFLSMMTSPMASVADMGLLCAIAILGATLADLLILPALIATVSQWKGFQRLPKVHE
jgi:predicted RND superfamily exporter protein